VEAHPAGCARSTAIWLLKIEKKADKWQGSVEATATRWPKATVEKFEYKNDVLSFTLKTTELPWSAPFKVPKEAAKSGKLYGSVLMRKAVQPWNWRGRR